MTPEREQFIRDMANDEWTDRVPGDMPESEFESLSSDWQRRTEEFLRDSTDPAELHLFALAWNWDGGQDAMQRIAEKPNCDAATALMIYWRVQPMYYSRYKRPDGIPADVRCGYDLAMAIQDRFLAGEYQSSGISYDPLKDYSGLDRIRTHHNHDWIPRIMFEPISPTANG